MSQTKAYRYARYSHSRQSEGMSLERQADAAEAWAKAHGLTIDDSHAPFVDEGVSASRGKNLVRGALSRFIKSVEAGDVPVGSYLLVESVSRFSRLLPQDSAPVLRGLCENGVRVVFLDTGMEVNADNHGDIQVGMIFQVLAYVAAHYAKDLSGYKLKAWGKARGQMRETGKVATRMVPFWLTCAAGDERVLSVHPVYGPIVERIFREYVSGSGKGEIAERLNADESAPTPGTGKRKSKHWRHTFIGRILRNRAVIGEFQPMVEVKTRITLKSGIAAALKRQRTDDGKPIPNYYPAVISEELFAQAAQIREQKRAKAGGRIGGRGEIRQILARLATCPICGGAMLRSNKGDARYPAKYVCSKAVAVGKSACRKVYVPVADVERALIDNAQRLCADAPSLDATLSAQLSGLADELSEADIECANLDEDIAGMIARGERVASAFNKMAVDLEAKRDALAARYAAIESKVAAASTNVLKARIAHLGAALTFYREAGAGFSAEALIDANAAMNECFSKVVIDYPRGELVCHWRHGPPPSVIRYAVDVYPDLGAK